MIAILVDGKRLYLLKTEDLQESYLLKSFDHIQVSNCSYRVNLFCSAFVVKNGVFWSRRHVICWSHDCVHAMPASEGLDSTDHEPLQSFRATSMITAICPMSDSLICIGYKHGHLSILGDEFRAIASTSTAYGVRSREIDTSWQIMNRNAGLDYQREFIQRVYICRRFSREHSNLEARPSR